MLEISAEFNKLLYQLYHNKALFRCSEIHLYYKEYLLNQYLEKERIAKMLANLSKQGKEKSETGHGK